MLIGEMSDPDTRQQDVEFVEAEAVLGQQGVALVAVSCLMDPAPAVSEASVSADHETPVMLAVGRYRLAFPGLGGGAERKLLGALAEKGEVLLIESPERGGRRFTVLRLRFPERDPEA